VTSRRIGRTPPWPAQSSRQSGSSSVDLKNGWSRSSGVKLGWLRAGDSAVGDRAELPCAGRLGIWRSEHFHTYKSLQLIRLEALVLPLGVLCKPGTMLESVHITCPAEAGPGQYLHGRQRHRTSTHVHRIDCLQSQRRKLTPVEVLTGLERRLVSSMGGDDSGANQLQMRKTAPYLVSILLAEQKANIQSSHS
jgi:hypothetical protein